MKFQFHTLLICILLIANVTLRLFTNQLNILPRHFNLIDVFIVFLLFLIFIFYVVEQNLKIIESKIFILITLFNIIVLIGSILNYKYFYLEPAVSQIIMYSEGIILFIILVNLPMTLEDVELFKGTLIVLLVTQILIGFIQIPLNYGNKGSDWVTGTFYGNHEQFGGFILIGAYYIFGKHYLIKKKIFFIGLLSILFLTLLIDNKASWFGILLSMIFLGFLMNMIDRNFVNKIKYFVIVLTILFSGYVFLSKTSQTLHKFNIINNVFKEGSITRVGKLYAFRDILKSHSENPIMSLVGSGSGTFYSRASSVFYDRGSWGKYDFRRSPHGLSLYMGQKEELRWSDSMGGVINTIKEEPFYSNYAKQGEVYFIGSRQIDTPWSSYAGLLGEAGILGIIIYLSIYFLVIKKLINLAKKYKNDRKIFPLIISSFGFMIYLLGNSTYNNWIENTRLTTIMWSMVAMVYIYDIIIKKFNENLYMSMISSNNYLKKVKENIPSI